jgi:hypothetical protein
VFLLTGAVLLTIGYVLVRHNINGPDLRASFDYSGSAWSPGSGPVGPAGFRNSSSKALAVPRRSFSSSSATRCTASVLEYVLALVAMTADLGRRRLAAGGTGAAPLREITATARRVSGREPR